MRLTASAVAAAAIGAVWAAPGALAASSSSAAAAAPGVTYDVLAVSGREAPGTGGLRYGEWMHAPMLSNNGVYAFEAAVIGEGTGGLAPALFVATPGGVQFLGREDGPATGLAGLAISGLNFYDINPSGVVLYRAFLEGPGTTFENGVAFYHGTPDALSLVARGGEPAPGGAAGETWRPGDGRLDAAGNVVISGAVAGEDDAVWAGPVNALTLVAREGEASPLPGFAYGWISPVVEMAPSGAFALRASELNSARDAYFVGTPGNLSPLVSKQDEAPGLPGLVLDTLSDVKVNSGGEAIVLARLGGPGVSDVNDDVLVAGTPGNLRVVARAGDAAPGTPHRFSGELDTHYDFIPDFGRSLQINDRGTVAFTSRLARPSPGGSDSGTFLHEWGIWAGDPDGLEPVVRNGERAPGTEEGIEFGYRPEGSSHDDFPFIQLLLNENDRLAFTSLLKGSDNPFDAGLFVADLQGNVQLVARVGDVLTIDGVDREILSIALGGEHSFNDLGQVGFVARFTDGTTASIVASVPEPRAWCAAALGLGALLRGRRHVR